MRSMRSGDRPVFTMWPPSITTTARLFLAADAIAFTTRRKSRATRTSGSDFRNAAKLRLAPGADANSAAATLVGRRSIGTVRTLERSTSAIGSAGALLGRAPTPVDGRGPAALFTPPAFAAGH